MVDFTHSQISAPVLLEHIQENPPTMSIQKNSSHTAVSYPVTLESAPVWILYGKGEFHIGQGKCFQI